MKLFCLLTAPPKTGEEEEQGTRLTQEQLGFLGDPPSYSADTFCHLIFIILQCIRSRGFSMLTHLTFPARWRRIQSPCMRLCP